MANQIQRGRTGQATFIGNSCCIYSPNDWYLVPVSGGGSAFYGTNSATPDTWHAVPGGMVTVPSTAFVAAGTYRISIVENDSDNGQVKIYDFVVIDTQNWGCVAGECTDYGDSPPEDLPTFATEAECLEGCGETYMRWLCDGETGVCTLTEVDDPDEGYATESECSDNCVSGHYCAVGSATIIDGPYVNNGFPNQHKRPDQPLFLVINVSLGKWVIDGDIDGVSPFFIGPNTADGPEGTYLGQDEYDGVTVTVSQGDCAAGRYICEDGTCTYDPTAVAPTGFPTNSACLIACSSGSDCALVGSLSFETVSGNQKRVTATVSGAVGTPVITFSTPASGVPNATATTCLVNVAAGETLVVTAHIVDGDCVIDRSITVSGDEGAGEGACTLDVSLALIDEPGSDYTIMATPTGASGAVTLSFYVDDVLTAPTSPGILTVNVDYGDTKTIAVVAFDGTCAAGETLTIGNGDNCAGGGTPENPVADDCVASLGIYYRDVEANTTDPGAVIWTGRLGLEVHPTCTNPRCQYWYQLFDSSNAALMGVYTDEALAAHFPVTLGRGASQTASGERIERYQVVASAISRPATDHKHFRIKATPVYQQVPFAEDGDVIKIRDLGANSLFLFEAGGMVRKWTAPDGFGAGSLTTLVDLATVDAGDATDAAMMGDKIFVIAPGEIFAYDLTTGEAMLNYGIRGETRTPTFIEVVGGRPIAIYCNNASTPKTRAYDLSFPAPKLVWEAAYLVTGTQVADGKLLLAAGASLYVSLGGTAAPTLAHAFASNVTAMAKDFVGLTDHHIWKNKSTGWASVETMVGPVGALWPWFGGGDVERTLAGAYSGTLANKLRAELPALNWSDDIVLTDATGIKSMRALTIETVPATENEPSQIEEWMLIGDDNATLWVYSRSAISEADGAFKACDVAAPRLFPFFQNRGS